jgi:hypothetical protein
MFPLGATFRGTAIDHVGHGGIHSIAPIEVGLSDLRGRTNIANSMFETKHQTKL